MRNLTRILAGAAAAAGALFVAIQLVPYVRLSTRDPHRTPDTGPGSDRWSFGGAGRGHHRLSTPDPLRAGGA